MVKEHRLEQIEFENKEDLLRRIPDFDFYRFAHITKIAVEWGPCSDAVGLCLLLTGEYESETAKVFEVAFCFEGVRQIRLPDMYEHGLWLCELELEDVAGHQLEGVAYKLHDYGADEFTVLCRTVRMISIKEL